MILKDLLPCILCQYSLNIFLYTLQIHEVTASPQLPSYFQSQEEKSATILDFLCFLFHKMFSGTQLGFVQNLVKKKKDYCILSELHFQEAILAYEENAQILFCFMIHLFLSNGCIEGFFQLFVSVKYAINSRLYFEIS